MAYNTFDFQTADPLLYKKLKEFAAHNRNNPTDAERILWQVLKSNGLGVRFRRQHIIGDYIADFVCLEKGVVIEIDGGYHTLPQQKIDDVQRTTWLNAHGYDVLRFNNDEVIGDIDYVIQQIENYIDF